MLPFRLTPGRGARLNGSVDNRVELLFCMSACLTNRADTHAAMGPASEPEHADSQTRRDARGNNRRVNTRKVNLLERIWIASECTLPPQTRRSCDRTFNHTPIQAQGNQ